MPTVMTDPRTPSPVPQIAMIHPAILGGVTACVLLGVVIFSADLGNVIAELTLLLTAAVISMSACIGAELIRLGFVFEQRARYLGSALMIAVALFFSVAFNARLSQDVRFAIMKSHYESELDRFEAGEATHEPVLHEGRMRGFYWLQGATSNWVGLVYDPSDALDQEGRLHIFGSMVVYSRRLAPGWFLCALS